MKGKVFDKFWWSIVVAVMVSAGMLVFTDAKAVDDPLRPFPAVLVDAACTDDFDAGGLGTLANPQLTGDPDGLCDGNTKILTGTFSVDTDIGPIGSVEYQNGYLYVDADTVGGGTDTWRICITIHKPWTVDTWDLQVECSETNDGLGAGNDFIGLGPMFVDSSAFDLSSPIPQPLPKIFKITIDLVAATSWAGSIGFIPIRGAGK
jgi:hypothetical protein